MSSREVRAPVTCEGRACLSGKRPRPVPLSWGPAPKSAPAGAGGDVGAYAVHVRRNPGGRTARMGRTGRGGEGLHPEQRRVRLVNTDFDGPDDAVAPRRLWAPGSRPTNGDTDRQSCISYGSTTAYSPPTTPARAWGGTDQQRVAEAAADAGSRRRPRTAGNPHA